MLEVIKTSSRKYGLASSPQPPWAPTHLQQTPTALDHIVSAGPSNPILPCLVWEGNGGLQKKHVLGSVVGKGALYCQEC